MSRAAPSSSRHVQGLTQPNLVVCVDVHVSKQETVLYASKVRYMLI